MGFHQYSAPWGAEIARWVFISTRRLGVLRSLGSAGSADERNGGPAPFCFISTRRLVVLKSHPNGRQRTVLTSKFHTRRFSDMCFMVQRWVFITTRRLGVMKQMGVPHPFASSVNMLICCKLSRRVVWMSICRWRF